MFTGGTIWILSHGHVFRFLANCCKLAVSGFDGEVKLVDAELHEIEGWDSALGALCPCVCVCVFVVFFGQEILKNVMYCGSRMTQYSLVCSQSHLVVHVVSVWRLSMHGPRILATLSLQVLNSCYTCRCTSLRKLAWWARSRQARFASVSDGDGSSSSATLKLNFPGLGQAQLSLSVYECPIENPLNSGHASPPCRPLRGPAKVALG